jgi:hypothetical protein
VPGPRPGAARAARLSRDTGKPRPSGPNLDLLGPRTRRRCGRCRPRVLDAVRCRRGYSLTNDIAGVPADRPHRKGPGSLGSGHLDDAVRAVHPGFVHRVRTLRAVETQRADRAAGAPPHVRRPCAVATQLGRTEESPPARRIVRHQHGGVPGPAAGVRRACSTSVMITWLPPSRCPNSSQLNSSRSFVRPLPGHDQPGGDQGCSASAARCEPTACDSPCRANRHGRVVPMPPTGTRSTCRAEVPHRDCLSETESGPTRLCHRGGH